MATKTGYTPRCGKILLTLRATQHILSVNGKPKNPKEKEPAGHDHVSAICQRFGVSRQTFYKLQEKFLYKGIVGLLPQQPGPKGPSKLTEEVLSFVRQRLEADELIAAPKLMAKVQTKFGMSLHRRTIEKLIKELRSKKNS